MDITLKEAQQQVDEWIKTVGVRYFSELTNLGILMEETGELARIMVRQYGDQTGVDLTDALQKNMEKKTIRDKDRHKENDKLK